MEYINKLNTKNPMERGGGTGAHLALCAVRRLAEQRFELVFLHAFSQDFVGHAHLPQASLDLAHAERGIGASLQDRGKTGFVGLRV
jgi:hypothetical protein